MWHVWSEGGDEPSEPDPKAIRDRDRPAEAQRFGSERLLEDPFPEAHAMATVCTPLTLIEAPAAWAAHESEIPMTVMGTLRTMGLADARRRLDSLGLRGKGRLPSGVAVRRALQSDSGLYDRIYEAVVMQFARGVAAKRVWRDKVGGWLYRVTRRVTQRLATARAADLFAEIQPTATSGDPLVHVIDNSLLPDELLQSLRLREVAARIYASLTPDERELLGLERDRDDVALARLLGTTPGALRVRRCRLLARIRRSIFQELGYDDQEAAE